MDVSRREFLRYSAGAGTALGGLVGLGLTLAPARAKAQQLRIKDSRTVPSICPFCSVGCGTLIHVKDGEIINIEGDPRSPHNEGTLCPKGAAIYQLHRNPNRPTKVLHRKPGATKWRSEEHTSELQSRQYLVCRLLLEKKKKKITCILISQKKQKKQKIQ